MRLMSARNIKPRSLVFARDHSSRLRLDPAAIRCGGGRRGGHSRWRLRGLRGVGADAESVAAAVQLVGDEAFALVDTHGAFPALGETELPVVEGMMFHRAPQHAPVEGLVVCDQRTALQACPDFGIKLLKRWHRDGVPRVDAVHRDVHPKVRISRRLNKSTERVADDAVFNRDYPNRASAAAPTRRRLKINRGEVHVAQSSAFLMLKHPNTQIPKHPKQT